MTRSDALRVLDAAESGTHATRQNALLLDVETRDEIELNVITPNLNRLRMLTYLAQREIDEAREKLESRA